MTGVIAIVSDVIGTLAGILAIWLGVKVLRDEKPAADDNDAPSEDDRQDTDRSGSDDPS